MFGVPHERLGEEVAAAVYLAAGQVARPPTSSRPTSPSGSPASRCRAVVLIARRAAPAQRGRQVPQARPARPGSPPERRQTDRGGRRSSRRWRRLVGRLGDDPRRAAERASRSVRRAPLEPVTRRPRRPRFAMRSPAAGRVHGVEAHGGEHRRRRAGRPRRRCRAGGAGGPRRRAARPPRRASADRRDSRGRRPRRDIGELTITRSSVLVAEHVGVGRASGRRRRCAPRRRSRPGAKNPGIAHDAATASATRGRRSPRPNTTRRPSDCRTAQIHSGSGGHASGQQRADPLRDHLGADRALGQQRGGQRRRPGGPAAGGPPGRGSPPGRRPAAAGAAGRSGGGPGIGPEPARPPAGPRPTAVGPGPGRAGRAPGSPARSDVPVIDPADVPTIDRRLPRVPPGRRRPARPARRRGTRRRRPRRHRAPTRRARRSRMRRRYRLAVRPPGGR